MGADSKEGLMRHFKVIVDDPLGKPLSGQAWHFRGIANVSHHLHVLFLKKKKGVIH